MSETEYDLHTKGAAPPDMWGHDAICVQLCRDAGLDDKTTDILLSRISLRTAIETEKLRAKIAEQDRLMESIGAGGVSWQRITGGRNG